MILDVKSRLCNNIPPRPLPKRRIDVYNGVFDLWFVPNKYLLLICKLPQNFLEGSFIIKLTKICKNRDKILASGPLYVWAFSFVLLFALGIINITVKITCFWNICHVWNYYILFREWDHLFLLIKGTPRILENALWYSWVH